MAKQTECWDANSVESSTVGALNLEAPTLRERLRAAPANHHVPVDNCSHEATDGDVADDSDVDDPAGERWAQNEERKKRGARKSRKMVWLEEQKQNLAEQSRSLKEKIRQQEDSDDGDLQDAINEGRLHKSPTRQQHSPTMRRHHLDRTTPAVGGAILACHPSKSSKMIVTSRSGDCYVTASDEFPATKPLLKSYKMDQFLTMPTLGLPSGDSHPLRDDSADVDQPLKTQFVISPPLPQSDEDKENENVQRKPERRRRAPKPSYLTTVKEGFGETFQRTKPSVSLDLKASRQSPQVIDDDVLSESLLSVASSSSLASEILERTKRRQEFWNETGAGR
ncbi:unnamed protein product [Lymnaea stagnalis]|uniref:Nuclear protein MDM1 n=1 Tax=Lymnaea stagnalis TaxID=6523 RepID=A0AAV2IGQ1_LYMST